MYYTYALRLSSAFQPEERRSLYLGLRDSLPSFPTTDPYLSYVRSLFYALQLLAFPILNKILYKGKGSQDSRMNKRSKITFLLTLWVSLDKAGWC